MLTALLPLKDLLLAKSRLAGLLHPSERCALTQAMAEDVLGVLASHAAVHHASGSCSCLSWGRALLGP